MEWYKNKKNGKEGQSVGLIERILCEPVRDVAAMHDFDNSFLSPCPRDIRTKDRTDSVRVLSGDRFTFVRSQWSWSWSLVRPFTFGRKKDVATQNRDPWYFHRSLLTAKMLRMPRNGWLENVRRLNETIYEYYNLSTKEKTQCSAFPLHKVRRHQFVRMLRESLETLKIFELKIFNWRPKPLMKFWITSAKYIKECRITRIIEMCGLQCVKILAIFRY